MTIKLESLVSELNLDPKGFTSGSKIALAATGALVAGIGAMVGAAGLAIKTTFSWADGVDKLGDVMGGTNKQMAAFAFVAKKSGVGVDALAKANTIMEKSLINEWGGLDKVGVSLYRYGINVKDVNGKVKDQATLTEEISKKYQALGTQQERLTFLTDIYGKSGGELVDFFDTLAQEGGIDAVTKKVEAFGLAIDPSRYEQFNRNLEELKLVGTGLAVQFTEKAMPALEGFLSYVSRLVPRLEDAFNERGWAGVWDVILGELDNLDILVANKISSMDFAGAGDALGNWIDKLFTDGIGKVDMPRWVVSLGQQVNTFFLHATGAADFGGWKQYFDAWGKNWETGWNNFLKGVEGHLDRGKISLQNDLIDIYNTVTTWINKIISALDKIPSVNIGQLSQMANLNALGQPIGQPSTTTHTHASGGSFLIPQSYGYEGFMMGNGDTASGGEKVTITPKGQDSQIDYDRMGRTTARYLVDALLPAIALSKA